MEVVFTPRAIEDLKYWKKSGNKIRMLEREDSSVSPTRKSDLITPNKKA